MATNTTSSAATAYRARLRGGPDDGVDVVVGAQSDGEPPEFLPTGTDAGMYLLAGLPNPDGSMPYWWVPAQVEAYGRPDPNAATWTLISLAEDGSTKLWHQHGEDSEPVQLVVESVDGTELPTHIGRAYNCPACHDTAVLSRPLRAAANERSNHMETTPRRAN